jgi:cobalt-zinc-cadmium efflux system membrane fusion protein
MFLNDPSTRNKIFRFAGSFLTCAGLIYVAYLLFLGRPKNDVAKLTSTTKPFEIGIELNETQVSTLKIETVVEQDFVQEKHSVGNIVFDQNKLVTVFAHYQGRLIDANLNVGDSVQAGQPLFTMQSPDLLTAEANLITVAGTSRMHNRNLARAKTLVKNGGISQQAADQVIADQQSTDGALKSARDNVRIFGKTDEEIDRIIAERKSDSTLVVKSPISGLITARAAAPGLYVQPGVAPAPYTIADTSTMWMVANVIENDAPLLQIGQSVSVRVAAFPEREFKGKIIVLGAAIDAASRRVFARCEVDNPENLLRAGMFATFVITTGAPIHAPAVPQNALVREMDGSMSAWTTTDRKHFTRKSVSVGLRQNNIVEIKSGLSAGEELVSDGAIFLSNQVAISAME